MERFVSEPYSPYDYRQQNPPYPAFHAWERLTDAEREAVLSYQDLGTKQNVWDVKVEETKHVTCSIINQYLRDSGFRNSLSRSDVLQCENLITHLDFAITKSVLPEELNVIRGLTDSRWTEGLQEGDVYFEDGFGSYSLSVDAALRYARTNREGMMVFLTRTLEAGDRALYLGQKEEEMLVERGQAYTVKEIETVAAGRLAPSCEAKVFILRKV